jgi:sugar/nucleoside kinase (ribokinase family)
MDDTALAYAASHSLVHSSVYSRTEDQLPALAAAGPLLSFDLSDEAAFRTPSYLDRVAPHLDLALLSCSDLPEPAVRDLLADVVRRGARIALATRGAHGAVVHDGRFLLTTPAVPADPHTLVDTMGCGDAFLAGFVVSLLRAGWSKDSPPARPALERALE